MADGLPWFKFNPQHFLDGVVGLTPEERGIYVTILALMYRRGEPIPDNPKHIAGNCECSVKVWNRVRKVLLERDKLVLVVFRGEARLTNRRAAIELGKGNQPASERSLSGDRELPEEAQLLFDLNKNSELSGVEKRESRGEENPPCSPPAGGTAREAFDLWNDLAERKGLAKAEILNEKRQRAIKARLGEIGGLDGWRRALGKIEASPFLLGLRPPREPGGKPFRADLDFICQPSSMAKLLEGKYDPAEGEALEAPKRLTMADRDRLDWQKRVRFWVRDKTTWDRCWGPEPGEPGCEAPADVLAEFGLNVLPFTPKTAAG